MSAPASGGGSPKNTGLILAGIGVAIMAILLFGGDFVRDVRSAFAGSSSRAEESRTAPNVNADDLGNLGVVKLPPPGIPASRTVEQAEREPVKELSPIPAAAPTAFAEGADFSALDTEPGFAGSLSQRQYCTNCRGYSEHGRRAAHCDATLCVPVKQ